MTRGSLTCMVALLLAACDRNLYVGSDAPKPLTETAVAGETAVATEPEIVDAGRSEPALQPTLPMQPPAAEAPLTCDAQHADCDHDLTNGCEVELARDREHCGACEIRCQTPDCSCENGKLVLRCDSTHGDCDANVNNGCETDLSSTMQHCGACQRACHANGHDATSASCVAGRCEIECQPRISPEVDCDGNPDNGCETYLDFDAQNCGRCGNKCARCEAGMCEN